jgi:hypothetical protein
MPRSRYSAPSGKFTGGASLAAAPGGVGGERVFELFAAT